MTRLMRATRRRHPATAACFLALALAAVAAASADARAHVRVSWARCIHTCDSSRVLNPGGSVELAGGRFTRGMRVVFTVRRGHRRGRASVAARALRSNRLVARVPGAAISGVLYVTGPRRVRSNVLRVTVRRLRPHAVPPASGASGTAFGGNGMWIWYVSQSSGGTPAGIAAQAHQSNVSTVFVKSSDGTNWWSQFSPAFVAQLKASGLHVCAWQYVYGTAPAAEAALGAQAVQDGADCLVIDAEKEYEGRYAQAQQYVSTLRQAIGPNYPLGLAGFPYVDYHASFPYSVFLGAGGAQFDVPQIYWKAIGDSVDNTVNHAYRFNRPYGRTIAPLGQAYDNTAPQDIVRFRQLAGADGAPGVSWWDWQEATAPEWQAIGEPLPPMAPPGPAQDDAVLGRGAKGDLVIWAQQHLNSAGQTVTVDGDYGPATQQAVTNFQASNGLPATGQVDTATWNALLRYAPAPVNWAAGARAAAAGARTGPPTARLHARRYEIPPKSHALP
jgi:hypothetical protein